MIGLESDLTPPEIAPPTVIPEPPRSKRSRKQSTSESVESQAPEPEPKSEPATVLITQVLPAVAQLHLSTWRGQLCEEIRNTANRIWPKSGDIGASTPPAFLQRRLDCESIGSSYFSVYSSISYGDLRKRTRSMYRWSIGDVLWRLLD